MMLSDQLQNHPMIVESSKNNHNSRPESSWSQQLSPNPSRQIWSHQSAYQKTQMVCSNPITLPWPS